MVRMVPSLSEITQDAPTAVSLEARREEIALNIILLPNQARAIRSSLNTLPILPKRSLYRLSHWQSRGS